MITVFGATGQTGSVVANKLLAAGKKVRVAVRDTTKASDLVGKGAEAVTVDVEDAASVAKALSGAEAAYFLIPPDGATTDPIGRAKRIVGAFVQALGSSSVRHVVALSSIGAQHAAGTGPIVTLHHLEEEIARTKVQATFVRASYFMENLLGLAHPMKTDGVLPVFGGGEGYKFTMSATQDIGETLGQALLDGEKAPKLIELSGEESSFEDAAAIASKILGRQVKAVPVPIEGMVPALTSAGYSAAVAGGMKEMTEGMGKGLLSFEGSGTSLKGKTPLSAVLEKGLSA